MVNTRLWAAGWNGGTVSEQRWEQMWLPHRPLAGDELAYGLYRMSRKDALTKLHIEANPQATSNLLVVDIDHPDAALRALSAVGNHPMPTAIVENPTNGHAHAVWGLHEPITRTERASLKAIQYGAAVAEGLRAAVGGDQGYSGLITKNPLHESWTTHWPDTQQAKLYDLAELEHALGPHMPERGWRRGRIPGEITGLGRNCTLFETSRHWAYRELRNWFGNPEGLSKAIELHVQLRNQAFAEPLPLPEALAVARSIAGWITRKSSMWKDGPIVYDATFTLIQSARSRKAAEKRSRNLEELIAELGLGGK